MGLSLSFTHRCCIAVSTNSRPLEGRNSSRGIPRLFKVIKASVGKAGDQTASSQVISHILHNHSPHWRALAVDEPVEAHDFSVSLLALWHVTCDISGDPKCRRPLRLDKRHSHLSEAFYI